MATKRPWAEWPKKAAGELTSVSGVAGVGGAAIGIASWSLLAGAPALVLTSFGAVVTAAAFGLALFRSFPVPLQRAEDIVAKNVPLRELSGIYPSPIVFAIVGSSMSGKTTLRNRLTFVAPTPTRTQAVTAQIVALQTAPPTYIAILDGGGEKYAQQFDLAAKCDHLCLVIDHNVSDVDTAVDQARLNEHAQFLKQVRHFLDENKLPPKKSIRILVNKKDLWKNATASDQALLEQFQTRELAEWKQGLRGNHIAVQPHSNSDATDIALLVDYLKACTTSGAQPHA